MSKSIKDILPFILDHNANWRMKLLNNWESIWGSLSSKVHLVRIDKHQLTIGVHDSCWLQELHMLSHLLIHTINKVLGSEQIKKLRFKKVEQKKVKPIPRNKYPACRNEQLSVLLSTKEKSALNSIKDPHLSHALKQFLIRCYQEK